VGCDGQRHEAQPEETLTWPPAWTAILQVREERRGQADRPSRFVGDDRLGVAQTTGKAWRCSIFCDTGVVDQHVEAGIVRMRQAEAGRQKALSECLRIT